MASGHIPASVGRTYDCTASNGSDPPQTPCLSGRSTYESEPIFKSDSQTSAPPDAPKAHHEVTPAPPLTPDGGRQRDGGVRINPCGPAGLGRAQQVQLDDVAATARALHRRRPPVRAFSRKVDDFVCVSLRQVLDDLAAIEERSPPRRATIPGIPEPLAQPGNGVAREGQPAHFASPTSLSPGMDRSGVTSAFPTHRENIRERASTSRSRNSAGLMKLTLTTAESALPSYR